MTCCGTYCFAKQRYQIIRHRGDRENIAFLSILQEHAENLRDTGVHGALIVYEDTFTIDTMAMALGITIGKNALYKHLVSEFSPLLKAARFVFKICIHGMPK